MSANGCQKRVTPRLYRLSRAVTAFEEAARVRSLVDDELELLLSDLATWVDVDTPGGDLEALDGLARLLGGTCERYGLEPELVPSPAGLYLHAALRGPGRGRVALLCHHDTVFPLGTAAMRPFRRDARRCDGAAAVRARRDGVRSGRGVAARAARDARPARGVRRGALPRVRAAGRGDRVGAKGSRLAAVHAEGRAAHAGEAP